ncbi:MAG: hypothetical protein PHX08_24145, partial [Lachnospiraceae bacterium]|nr:hypothetical protein [Lachnospiraceae bacterium]
MIPASGTKDIAIDLNSRADLVQKPYEIAMSMKYEDGSGTQYDGTSTLAIPVKQPARFEFSEFEISSETVEVGADINVMCNLYNLGRVKLYNVKAKFQGEGIKSQDVYVGNVESGATASIDAMVTGEKETTGDGKTKMIVTYEDEAGTVFTVEKELVLMVTPAVDKVQEGMAVEDTQNKLPIVPILVVILVIAAITVTIVIVRRAKKKKLVQEEEKLADELDRLIEDE